MEGFQEILCREMINKLHAAMMKGGTRVPALIAEVSCFCMTSADHNTLIGSDVHIAEVAELRNPVDVHHDVVRRTMSTLRSSSINLILQTSVRRVSFFDADRLEVFTPFSNRFGQLVNRMRRRLASN